MSFPDYSHLSTRAKIADLERLAVADLTANEYVNGKGMAHLLAVALKSYRDSMNHSLWKDDPFLRKAADSGLRFQLYLAALFDLACNIEYVHGRLVNSKWIYCNREDQPRPVAYYSFLKQCPRCCLDRGLEKRLAGAQHKPSSHHIGEITTTAMALLLQMVLRCNARPLSVSVISKQSHDVDVVACRDDLLLLLEVKASPMVSFPIGMELDEPLLTSGDGSLREYKQHSLVDIPMLKGGLHLYLPHRGVRMPVPRGEDVSWPYEPAIAHFGQATATLEYFSAWLELFEAYSVPKTQRDEKQTVLAYLVNGWGDEIDSNKTKPGLGRTDDIKKGTYQLLKFGAYYADDSAKPDVLGALATNLDPLFMRADYFDKLADIRWGHSRAFTQEGDEWRIANQDLHYLYNAVMAFNRPVINDQRMEGMFDMPSAERWLLGGRLNDLLHEWTAGAS